ncbi:hypothetical protein [Flavobacterium suncheonense]|uniref:Uncharacterized protein n=1 Tax=Flavobacterium suncheonense GH29-5 = DSM 17707 TaxID=1121899 RepID=A0A0A2MAS0_9FLAO|nr:hypothetical protein [Flavobacterium suncheonense]KGO89752.1 hypothetical protein Q764_06070 [Flavobacterium suncheonense GH29-5 = DSM 17707]
MRRQIENTKAFKALNFIQKKVYSKRATMLEIENQFIVAKNKGVEVWLKDYHPNRIYKEIIQELLTENRK